VAVLNPYILGGVAIAWLLSLISVGVWQRADGTNACVAEYAVRDNKSLITANDNIRKLGAAVRQQEANHQRTLADLGVLYAKEFGNVESNRKRDVAAAYERGLRLRDPNATCGGAAGSASAIVPAGPQRDGAAGCELSGKVTADLFDLAADADRNTVQLNSCQATVKEYLARCNSEQ
jgi:hypothetical protein